MAFPRQEISQKHGALGVDLEAGLLPDLALHALMEGFPFIEPASGKEPEGVRAVPDQEEVVLVHQKPRDADAKPHAAKVSGRDRIVKLCPFGGSASRALPPEGRPVPLRDSWPGRRRRALLRPWI
jgi:hypothetical protein